MRDWALTVLLMLGIMGGGLIIVGCSGAGAPAADLRGASVQALAEDTLSAVVLVRSWFAVLHTKSAGIAPSGLRPCAACTPVENYSPDYTHFWGTWSDCGQFDYTTEADGSGQGWATWPDGRRQDMTWGPPAFRGMRMLQDIDLRFQDGARFEYKLIYDFGRYPMLQIWDGQATLADGRSMQFVLERYQSDEFDNPGQDRLRLTLPDGSRLVVSVPTGATLGTLYWPVFATGAKGTFVDPSGATMRFRMTGDEDRWTTWTLDAAAQGEGSFTFGEGLSATGQLRQGAALLGALRWDADALGVLDLATIGSEEVTPSRAARDFAVDRWFGNLAAMGPSPMY